MKHDPEIEALTAQIRAVVSQAYVLTRKLDTTLTDLQRFADHTVVERRRMNPPPYKGDDRRG